MYIYIYVYVYIYIYMYIHIGFGIRCYFPKGSPRAPEDAILTRDSRSPLIEQFWGFWGFRVVGV